MSQMAEKYFQEREPKRVSTDDGYVFQVRPMGPEHWAEIYGGIPTFDGGSGQNPTVDEVKELQKRVYLTLADGLVDGDQVVPIPYEKLLQKHLAAVTNAILNGGPFSSPDAETIRRSLPES